MTSVVGYDPSLARALVRDAMQPGVLTCLHVTPLREAAALMADRRIHALVLVGLDDQRDRDLRLSRIRLLRDVDVVRAVAAGAADGTAGDAAPSEAPVIGPGEALSHAVEIMTSRRAAHLLVVDPATERPVGMLSTLDVARSLARARP